MGIESFFASLLLIASAELGDKTQLLTLAFAAKYPFGITIGAISLATAGLMALAVAFGGVVNLLLPQIVINNAAGIMFIAFGLWTMFGEKEVEEEPSDRIKAKSPFFIIFGSFFLAELGDKTQLATFTLTAKYGFPLQVWLGATVGMIFVNILAALAGKWIKRFIPDIVVMWLSGLAFIIFGILAVSSAFSI